MTMTKVAIYAAVYFSLALSAYIVFHGLRSPHMTLSSFGPVR